MIKGIRLGLAECGKIKIGRLGKVRESKNGTPWRPPVKLDHFIVTKNTRDKNGDLELDVDLMEDLCRDGSKLREIPVILHSDNIDEVFPTSYACYAGKRLACSGDGERAIRWQFDAEGKRTNKTLEMACTCELLGNTDRSRATCKPHGTLHCSIAVPGRAVAGAVHRWRTTSIISIQRMLSSLIQIQQIVGSLRGIPLVLKIEDIIVTPDGKPSSVVYCCHLELRAKDVLEVQRHALEMSRMRQSIAVALNVDYRALVAAPGALDESEDEQAEVAEEFHPEFVETDAYEAPADARAPKLAEPPLPSKGAAALKRTLAGAPQAAVAASKQPNGRFDKDLGF